MVPGRTITLPLKAIPNAGRSPLPKESGKSPETLGRDYEKSNGDKGLVTAAEIPEGCRRPPETLGIIPVSPCAIALFGSFTSDSGRRRGFVRGTASGCASARTALPLNSRLFNGGRTDMTKRPA
jgi:hypothetical protein